MRVCFYCSNCGRHYEPTNSNGLKWPSEDDIKNARFLAGRDVFNLPRAPEPSEVFIENSDLQITDLLPDNEYVWAPTQELYSGPFLDDNFICQIAGSERKIVTTDEHLILDPSSPDIRSKTPAVKVGLLDRKTLSHRTFWVAKRIFEEE